MKCPKCGIQISALSGNCIVCSYVFSKEMNERLNCYFGIKGDIEQVQSLVKNEVWTRLKGISKRVEEMDKLFSQEPVFIPDEPHPDESLSYGYDKPKEKTVSPSPLKSSAFSREHKPAAIKPLASSGASESSRFEVNLGQKGLLIAGIITMVFGIGYFLKYSFDQGWVGPAGRVAMAYIWGILMLGTGTIFRKRNMETFGLYLIGGGIAILYASTFAGFQLYHLFDQLPSFGIMVLITILAGTLAIVYDTKWLAVLGLIGGFLTPLLLSTGQDNQIGLMSYMTILNLGLLGIAFYKKWDLLNALGFVFTYLLYTAWHFGHYSTLKFWPAIIFLNIFYLIYSVMPFAYQFLRSARKQFKGLLIIAPNSFIAFGYSYEMIKGYAGIEWVSVVTVFYAVVFLSMATYLLRTGNQEEEAFTVLLAKAALFLVITIPILVSNHWITIFWAVQAAVLLWMGTRLQRKMLVAGAYILLLLSICKFLLYDYGTVFHFSAYQGHIYGSYTYLITERIITSLVLLLATGWFAVSARRNEITLMSKAGKDVPYIAAVNGIVLFIILNIETASFFYDYLLAARFAAISVLWAVFSILMVVAGFRSNSVVLRKASLGLFAATIIKVFLFDMSNISTPYRIISFIILGLMLVGTSYLYYKFREKFEGFQGGNER